MRRIDDTPLDPEIATQLDAIDATLAGEPVDPQYAELAELALLLAADRPAIRPAFAHSLDQSVARRFSRPPPAGEFEAGTGLADSGGPRPPRRPRRSWLGPLAGLSMAAVAAVVAVVAIGTGGGSPSTPTVAGISTSSTASANTTTSAQSSAPATQKRAPSGLPFAPSSSTGASSAPLQSQGGVLAPGAPSSGSAPSVTPQPLPNGRKVLQSAQLALNAAGDRLDTVAQELFVVIGRENGYVSNSTVTAGSNGYAQFELSVPSSALQATMTALTQLQYTTVASRTDATQDVNGEYLSDQRRLADDRSLRTSLLKQLAAATTQQQIDSLNVQIRDAEASISSDEATLRGLNHRIDYSQISVSINAAALPAPLTHHSGGFTLGKALHDAGRVLTVAAGVALIALAALVPVVLVGAIGWWIALALRRRRREQALDLA